jgi:hypothetical protein
MSRSSIRGAHEATSHTRVAAECPHAAGCDLLGVVESAYALDLAGSDAAQDNAVTKENPCEES